MTKLGTILDQIDSGTLLLPEFQRGYVWNRDQVRALMRSLYYDYPVGSMLVWETETPSASVRGDAPGSAGVKQLLLDGQQRITSLYGVVRGKPPAFFEGNATAFTRLMFDVEAETFEFFAAAKMQGDPRWIDVTALFTPSGIQDRIAALSDHPDFARYVMRLTRLRALLERDFHAEKITGADKSVDVVVDIFNRVNSGGTKLSKGDLALAKICAAWPEARAAMRQRLATWQSAGYDFSLDWLLRNTNAIATGRAPFGALDGVSPNQFEDALTAASKYIGALLDAVSGRLGLDHDRVLMGRYAIPVLARHLHLTNGQLPSGATLDRMLFWYVHSALWGRFTGSTETALSQDYEAVETQGVDGLITALERARGGNLTIGAHDFEGFGRGSRFYPLLYLLTRVHGARDFGTGLPLHAQMLGHLATLQVHHIFPKALLYEDGYARSQVKAVANFCFLTQQTNLAIGKRRPEDYFAATEAEHPGALASQWIPTDRTLWRVERYGDFLAARRTLLADAANGFLNELRSGAGAPSSVRVERVAVVADSDDERDERVSAVDAAVAELMSLGFAAPERDQEINDPADGRVLAVAEAHWAAGLQPGLGPPVALELDRDEMNQERLEELGYQVFTTVTALRSYASQRVDGEGDGDGPTLLPASSGKQHGERAGGGRRYRGGACARHRRLDGHVPPGDGLGVRASSTGSRL